MTVADEPVPARDGGFDIFAVHERLIHDYRAFTEGSAVIRDDRIAKAIEADLDAKSQWPDPWLSLNPFFADGGSAEELADGGWLRPECADIFQVDKTEDGTSCDGTPIRFYRHQADAIKAARAGGSYVADHRHRVGQVAGLHRADRGPGAARPRRRRPGQAGPGHHRLPDERPGQQPVQRAEEVPARRVPQGKRAGDLRPVHRAGGPGRAGQDPQRPAGHPADQLRDAGAHAHPAPGPADADPHGARAGVPRLRRAAHLPGPAGRGRRAAHPPGEGRLRCAGRAVRRDLGDHVHRGHQRAAPDGRRPRRDRGLRHRRERRQRDRGDPDPRHR